MLGMYRTCGEASLRWRLRFREINILLALWNRMSGIRGRCSRVLQPSIGFRVSVRDDFDSDGVPSINVGPGGWTLGRDVEKSRPSKLADRRPVWIRVRQGNAGIGRHISPDVKW